MRLIKLKKDIRTYAMQSGLLKTLRDDATSLYEKWPSRVNIFCATSTFLCITTVVGLHERKSSLNQVPDKNLLQNASSSPKSYFKLSQQRAKSCRKSIHHSLEFSSA